MNGAAVKCQQEQAPHPQHNGCSSLQSPGYLLKTTYPCQEKTSQHQYSKAMNYKLLPDNFSVDGSSEHFQYKNSFISEAGNKLSNSGDIWDTRINPTRTIREPMELPVPKFEVDEHSVGVFTYKKDKINSVQDSKDLDLDTRIDLLIKSKALSGVHPIFSDLNESEDSSTDSEASFSDIPKFKHITNVKISPPEHVVHQKNSDNPEKPLSRPPSPFLSRATYLFWFNKAIERKQHAKAQEKALLEKATKKLSQGNFRSDTVSKTANSEQDNNLLKTLLSELSKELKESIKQDFITEIIENTVQNGLEEWWVNEKKLEEANFSKDFPVVTLKTLHNFQSNDRTEFNDPANFKATEDIIQVSQDQTSPSPKGHFPENILEHKVTSIIEFNKTSTKAFDTDILEGLTSDHSLVLGKENDCLGSKSLNENSAIDNSFFEEGNPLTLEEVGTNNSINYANDTSGLRNASINEIFVDKSNGNLKQDLKVDPADIDESNNCQHSHLLQNLPIFGTSIAKSLKEKILVEMQPVESLENTVIKTSKPVDMLENLEEKEFSSNDSSPGNQVDQNDKQDSSFLQYLINNKENNS